MTPNPDTSMKIAMNSLIRLLICGCLVSGLAAEGRAQDRPNLLLIYLDDFGWRDAGFMGSDFYETPNLDRLAKSGMVFTNAYANAANCAPSRASLMCGQYTPRHRLFTVGTRFRGQAAYRRLIPSKTVDVLDPGLTTWVQLMHDAGYRTASMGKWHLSEDPLPYGFDVNVGGSHSGGPPNGYYPPHGNKPGLQDIPDDEYLTDTLSSRAADFIESNSGHRWMLYLTHFAVHTPLQPKRELLDKYRAKAPGRIHDDVTMATMIEAVDQGVGRIVETLERTGQLGNTVIIFTSDNGGFGPATSMAPLRGYKGTFYEGGIRVPLFVVWPGVTEPGTRCEVPVIAIDLFPTVVEVFGLEPVTDQVLDGISWMPLLTGAVDIDSFDRPLFWHFPRYLQSYRPKAGEERHQRDPLFRTRPVSVVRHGDWKLLKYFEDGVVELFNLADDVAEKNDLAREQPERVARLIKVLEQWWEEVDAPVPTELNPEFDAETERRAIRRRTEL